MLTDVIGALAAVAAGALSLIAIIKWGALGTFDRIMSGVEWLVGRILYGPPSQRKRGCEDLHEIAWLEYELFGKIHDRDALEHVKTYCTLHRNIYAHQPKARSIPKPPGGSGGGSGGGSKAVGYDGEIIKSMSLKCEHPNLVVSFSLDGMKHVFCPDCKGEHNVWRENRRPHPRPPIREPRLPDPGRGKERRA